MIDYLRQYLEQMREMKRFHAFKEGRTPTVAYLGMEDLLLQHGQAFVYARFTAETIWRFKKACFENCYQLAKQKGSPWRYVEGMAWNPQTPFPVNHAWLVHVDQPGIAYDPTWTHFTDPAATAYLGIVFKNEYIKKALRRSQFKAFGVLDAWYGKDSWPLLTGKDRIEDAVIK